MSVSFCWLMRNESDRGTNTSSGNYFAVHLFTRFVCPALQLMNPDKKTLISYLNVPIVHCDKSRA